MSQSLMSQSLMSHTKMLECIHGNNIRIFACMQAMYNPVLTDILPKEGFTTPTTATTIKILK